MKHAIYAPTVNEYADVEALVELAVESERAGFDGFFVWDELFMEPGVPIADAMVALGAVALATERMRIGTMVTPLARRRPWKLAKELTTLDRLSKGRVTLGIGLGEPADIEFGNVGDDATAKGRAARLDEGLAVLAPLLRGETVNYSGEHFRIRDTRVTPACVQQPLPIWGGASLPAKAGIRRAARWNGIFPISFPESPAKREDGSFDMAEAWLAPEIFAEVVETTLEFRAQLGAGHAPGPFDFVASGDTSKDSAEQARSKLAAYEAAGATWWFEWLDDRAGQYDAALAHVRRGPEGGA